MRKSISIILLLFVWTCASAGRPIEHLGAGEPPEGTNHQAAVSVWEGYIAALKAGDEEKAKGFWSENSRTRYRVFDWQLPDFEQAVDLARNDRFEIEGISDNKDSIELRVRWSNKVHTYYLVEEQNNIYLANPIDVLTSGWEKKDTAHFVLHFESGNEPTRGQIEELEGCYKYLSSLLSLTLVPNIDYYKCASGKEVGALFGMAPALGRGHIMNNVVGATRWTSFHEVTHLFFG
jgi:hypothetical protein